MLDLHAGVHFDEIELAVLVQKLERAGAPVADFLAGRHTAITNAIDEPTRNAWCRCLLDHLLVAALHGAVALAQVHGIAVLVGQDLDLDMARVLQEFFHVDRRISKRGPASALVICTALTRAASVHHAHAAPAPPPAALMMTG